MKLISTLHEKSKTKMYTLILSVFSFFIIGQINAQSQCACLNSPANRLLNGSFETANGDSSTANWHQSGGGSFESHTGTGNEAFQVCGNWYGMVTGVNTGTAVYQDVTGIPVGDLVTFSVYSGVLHSTLGCVPTLSLLFYNGNTLLSASTVNVSVTRDVSVTPSLELYTLSQIVPAGATKVRVQGSVTCEYLKMDAACLTSVPGGPTPVKLSSFNAAKQDKKVDLTWQTSTEVNSDYFEVQFSKNGRDWMSVGIVNAAGFSTTTRNYSLVHNSPVNGINYYRLKQVDASGNYELSETRTVSFRTDNSVTVMPNPTHDRLFITSDLGGSLQSVTLYTDNGKPVYTATNFLLGNSIDMSSFSPGMYMLKIVNKDGNVEVKKVMKK